MNPASNIEQLAVIALVALAVAAMLLVFLWPTAESMNSAARVKAIVDRRMAGRSRQSTLSKIMNGQKDNRRKQVQETLRQIEERETQRRSRLTLRALIMQSGVDMSVRKFWILSAAAGGVLFSLPALLGLPLYLSLLSSFVGTFGLPRWLLSLLRKRRQEAFLDGFADAIDVMVRGLKAGLPVSDAMKVIATEAGPPIGPEFIEVVDGQRVGIALEQGLERMFERMPLPEVNFLAIVMSIQSKTGGNLTETLTNLSKVLRERRKMKSKVQAVSQEAKSSAAIIGSLPFCIIGLMTLTSPGYLDPMFSTSMGNAMLIGSGIWMLMGILVMRKMINFNI